MSYQKTFLKKENNFKIYLFIVFLIASVTSCNNDTANKSGTALAPTVTLPIFTWKREDIVDLIGENKKNPKTMLIKIGHDNYNNHIATMKLYLYPADDHKDYAVDEDGIQVKQNADIKPVNINNSLIIGNNDFDFEKFTTGAGANRTLKEFAYAKFTPVAIPSGDGKTHLGFKITLESAAKTVLEDLGDTNPSPPADPSHNQ